MAKTVDRELNPQRHSEEGFYEALPSFMPGQLGFRQLEAEQEAESVETRSRMWRQLIFLGVMLIVQLVLFAVLIGSVANLG